MPTVLTNTNIKDTYQGLMHVNDVLPVTGVTNIFDGVGNSSAISLGRSDQGVTITGTLNSGGLINAGSGLNVTGSTNATGDVHVTGQVNAIRFNTTSSKRYKRDITPIENSSYIVSKLQGVRFNWKETGLKDIGLIAEDVNEVLPEAVSKNKKGEVESVDYSKLVPVLINTINALAERIDKLEQKH